MPNWVTNKVHLFGERALLLEAQNFLRSEESAFDFNKLIPEPVELLKFDAPVRNARQALKNTQNYGASDWYEWRIKYWQTKWNACDSRCEYIGDELVFVFNTAWSWPEPIFQALIDKFPELEIRWEWHEESDVIYVDENNDEYNENWYIVEAGEISKEEIELGAFRPYSMTSVERPGNY